jgi:8-oxoguanine deaminase
MRLASGIAPVKKYMQHGVKVGIGVDGSASNDASNMLLETRQAMLLARLRLGLRPPEGPAKYVQLPVAHPLRASEWMTAREALELATIGGAKVLGRTDIGSLEPGKCADFFSIDLHTVDYAGALTDPVAATVFCAPQRACYTVVHGRIVVDNGRVSTVEMGPVVEDHNQWGLRLAVKRVERVSLLVLPIVVVVVLVVVLERKPGNDQRSSTRTSATTIEWTTTDNDDEHDWGRR